MPKYNVHILVICCNEERKTFQKQQFAALGLPYDVTYAQAYTPATSKSYIVDYDSKVPEYDTTLCCMRSHAAVLDWFYHNTESDYVLVIEDDVMLWKDGLHTKLERVIDLYEKHSDVIDYVSIGYLISSDNGSYCIGEYQDGDLHWGKQSHDLWGMQAYLIKRPIVKNMIAILHQPNTAVLRTKVTEAIYAGRDFSHRYPRVQSDSLFPILFRQGFVQPILAIERPFQSAIENRNSFNQRWTKPIEAGTINISNYYGCS